MPIRADRLLALAIPERRQRYTWRDAALYALGVGVGIDPLDEDQLRFVDETRLRVLPSFATVLAYPGFWIRDLDTGIDWRRVVNGGQEVRLHHPLPPEGEVVAQTRIVDLTDKGAGKGALITTERVVVDTAAGRPLATVRQTVLCRGDGGFSGAAPAATPRPLARPAGEAVGEKAGAAETEAPIRVTLPTHSQLALVYRLSGDLNPLHLDPAVARAAGFDRPILHGLATYGIACHALVKGLCGYDPTRARAMAGRFSSPVLPGETITVDIRPDGPGRASFRALAAERGAVVIDQGRFDYEGGQIVRRQE